MAETSNRFSAGLRLLFPFLLLLGAACIAAPSDPVQTIASSSVAAPVSAHKNFNESDFVQWTAIPEGAVALLHWLPAPGAMQTTERGHPFIRLEVEPFASGPIEQWIFVAFHVKPDGAWPTAWTGRSEFTRFDDRGATFDPSGGASLEPLRLDLVSNETALPGFWFAIGAKADRPTDFGVRLTMKRDVDDTEPVSAPVGFPLSLPWRTADRVVPGFGAAYYREQFGAASSFVEYGGHVRLEREAMLRPTSIGQAAHTHVVLESTSPCGWSLSTGYWSADAAAGSFDLAVQVRDDGFRRSGPMLEFPVGSSAMPFSNFRSVGDGSGASRVDLRTDFIHAGPHRIELVQFELAVTAEEITGTPSLEDWSAFPRDVDKVPEIAKLGQFAAVGWGSTG